MSEKLAIMQPYIFPYISYFQLINAVDTFVVYDDVNYIKKGWINRNFILENNKGKLFTFPLINASQNKKINELLLNDTTKWREKFLKTVDQNYKKAPFFNEIYPLIQNLIFQTDPNLVNFIVNSLKAICKYLSIDTKFIISSSLKKDNGLKGEDKIIEICQELGAKEYLNPIGGLELYNGEVFSKEEIKLFFLKSKNIEYRQFAKMDAFVPWLSIIDLLMFNSRVELKNYINQYELI